MAYRLLADVVLVVHFGYLVYLVLGGFVAWRWPRAFWPHLVAVVWGVAVVAFSIACPLTGWENALRSAAGEATYAGSFIDRYIGGVVYPQDQLEQARWLVVVCVAVSWLGVWWRWRARRGRTGYDRSERPRMSIR